MKDDVFLFIYIQGFDLVFGVRPTKERDRVTFLTPRREGRSHPPRCADHSGFFSDVWKKEGLFLKVDRHLSTLFSLFFSPYNLIKFADDAEGKASGTSFRWRLWCRCIILVNNRFLRYYLWQQQGHTQDAIVINVLLMNSFLELGRRLIIY